MRIDLRRLILETNVLPGITILAAVVVAVLGTIPGIVDTEYLVAATLAVLSSIVALILATRKTMLQIQGDIRRPVNGFLLPLDELKDEIREAIRGAHHVWLLSRTGIGWWDKYHSEFDRVLKGSEQNRFMFLDPNDGALRMVAEAAVKEWRSTNYPDYQRAAKDLFNWFDTKRHDGTYKGMKLRVINHLPAWTLVMINPTSRDDSSIIYVELATYRAGSESRPVFKVKPQDIGFFNRLLGEYEDMWGIAREWK